MKKACLFVAVLVLSSPVFPLAGQTSGLTHAEVSRIGSNVTVHVFNGRPVEHALATLRRQYGSLIDYEQGGPLTLEDEKKDAYSVLPVPRSLTVTVREPSGSSEDEMATFLKALASAFSEAGASSFTVLSDSEGRFSVVPTAASSRILDTKVIVPAKTESVDQAINDVCTQVTRQTGLSILRGGLVDNGLASTQVTVGSQIPTSARQLITEALGGTRYKKFWILTWEPSMASYILGVQTAVRLERGFTGDMREVPLLNSSIK